MKEKSLKKNTVFNFLKAIVSLIFPFITFPYVSRVLGVEKIGQVNFANNLVNYFVLISGLGISNYAIREGVKYRDDKRLISQFSMEMIIINLLSTLISYILLFIVISIPSLADYRMLMLLFSTMLIFNIVGINWLFNIFEEFGYITFRTIIMQIVSLVLLLFLVRGKEDYLKYTLVLVISSVGANIFNISYARKFISYKTYKKPELLKHLKPILIIFAMSVASNIYLNIDTTMLGFMLGDYEVGIYTAGSKINKIIVNLLSSVLVVFLPRLSYYVKLGKKEEFTSMVDKALNYILGLTIPACIGFVLLSKEIILLFSGSEFIGAIPVLMIKAPNIIFSVLNGFIAIQLFMPLGKEKISLYATLCGALLNVFFNVLLIPKFGAVGSSVATIVAEGVVMIVCVCALRKDYTFDRLKSETGKYIVASVCMVPVGMLFKHTGMGLFGRTVSTVFFDGIIYVLVLYAMKAEIIIENLSLIRNKLKT